MERQTQSSPAVMNSHGTNVVFTVVPLFLPHCHPWGFVMVFPIRVWQESRVDQQWGTHLAVAVELVHSRVAFSVWFPQ